MAPLTTVAGRSSQGRGGGGAESERKRRRRRSEEGESRGEGERREVAAPLRSLYHVFSSRPVKEEAAKEKEKDSRPIAPDYRSLMQEICGLT